MCTIMTKKGLQDTSIIKNKLIINTRILILEEEQGVVLKRDLSSLPKN